MDNQTRTPSGSMKQSVSMTSLPPPGPQEVSDMAVAKMRLERPYNSLKKKRNSERDIWRNSWGSGHSHASSCSIHSTATNGGGSGIGKDDFWAALQPNYNYIMDTNLLDSCREARCEFEGASAAAACVEENCCEKSIGPSTRTQNLVGDPRRLRRWLREMENEMTKAPSISSASKMKSTELKRRLNEHSGLYREIVSQGRLVAACIRSSKTAATNDKNQSVGKSNIPSETRKGDENIKALERRYHLLYLKAIEVQCVFETLLARKESSTSSDPLTPSDTDEEPLAKLQKLSDVPRDPKICSDSEEYLDAKGSDDEWFQPIHLAKTFIDSSQTAGFDADSEGSDNEANPKLTKSTSPQPLPPSSKPIGQHLVHQADHQSTTAMDTTSIADCNGNSNFNGETVARNDVLDQCTATTPVKSGATKRTRQPDASKFNRSNRKSKNCAIFYFKHLDTDGENKDWSSEASETSEAFKSTASSEDEWIFSNRNDKQNDDDDDYDEDRNDASINTLVPVNDYNLNSTDVVDAPLSYKTNNGGERNGNSSGVIDDTQKKFNGNQNATTNGKGYAPFAMQYTKESIKQLVIEAETLVREEILGKTPLRSHRQSYAEMSVHKNGCDGKATMSYPKIKRVQEWLHHQPSTPPTPLSLSQVGTDCETSGEYTTESDSVARDSDSPDNPSDSIATCLQDGRSNSQCTSTEVIGHSSSADPLNTLDNESNEMMGSMQQQVTMRSKRRNSDRPHSVSCLSQLNDTRKVIRSNDEIANQGLANHSISESALNTLSSPTTPSTVSHSTSGTMKTSESKSSLKKRRMRTRRRLAVRKSESGSNGSSDCGATELSRIISSTLVKSESFSGQSTLMKDLSKALSLLSIPRKLLQNASSTSEMESEDDAALPKPKFQLGAYTSVYGSDIAQKLGSSLAALANYNGQGEAKDLSFTGTDNSNFSEQAWDNYQEKYLSEAYSEGFDSDAARRLMEFGDDYRNFLDSQSDCCSSLSAANNFDSLSPPRNRKPRGLLDNNSHSNSPSGDDLTLRRRRTAEFESERRRKGCDGTRKVSSEESKKSSGDSNAPLRRLSNKSNHNNASRKLEHDFIAGLDKRKNDDSLLRRRLRSNDKSFSSPSSSSCSEPEDETELKTLLAQSKSRLENTDALRIRHHLLRPEDYAEIIATCRDNVHCLQTVLRARFLATVIDFTMDWTNIFRNWALYKYFIELLSSWESLLHWSENASVARQLQEEMLVLKSVLNKLGNRDGILDSESSIQMSIDELKNEKAQLHTHRSTMLRLNASVHSWLTRQEMKMEKSKTEITTTNASTINANSDQKTSVTALNCTISNEPVSKDTAAQFDINFVDEELHKQLKNEVGDMYSTWDEADQRISSRLESLTTSLIAWKQFESGMTEFKEALGKDKGTLKGLTGALEMCGDDNEHSLAHDVKEVAKRLSERSESNIQQIAEQTKNIHLSTATVATAFNLKSTSNGSLSDSGMSDGGGSSDYSISERERHLNVLRRLARQLESALAPGSAAIISISQRMEAAEADLRSLQDTCRALIVQTAASHNQNQYGTRGQMQDAQTEMSSTNVDGELSGLTGQQQAVQLLKIKQPKRFVQIKRKPRRRSNGSSISPTTSSSAYKPSPLASTTMTRIPSPEPDPDDPSDELDNDEKDPKKWAWRLAKYAVPVQVALVALICAICCLEPHCCDAVNNFSMSFSPQLRYVRGPPPI